MQKYLDADLLDKDNLLSKQARTALGIGMPEVRAIQHRMKLPKFHGGMHCRSVRDYIDWYRQACKVNGSYGAHVDL